MRPLPVEPLPETPRFVRGTSIVRGRATPVVDLRVVLGEASEDDASRFLTVRTGEDQRVALLVDAVLGLRDAHQVVAGELPSLIADAAEVVEQLARLDGQLLTVLRAGTLVPADVWARLSASEAT